MPNCLYVGNQNYFEFDVWDIPRETWIFLPTLSEINSSEAQLIDDHLYFMKGIHSLVIDVIQMYYRKN